MGCEYVLQNIYSLYSIFDSVTFNFYFREVSSDVQKRVVVHGLGLLETSSSRLRNARLG